MEISIENIIKFLDSLFVPIIVGILSAGLTIYIKNKEIKSQYSNLILQKRLEVHSHNVTYKQQIVFEKRQVYQISIINSTRQERWVHCFQPTYWNGTSNPDNTKKMYCCRQSRLIMSDVRSCLANPSRQETLLRKLRHNRGICEENISYYHYKGKQIPSTEHSRESTIAMFSIEACGTPLTFMILQHCRN